LHPRQHHDRSARYRVRRHGAAVGHDRTRNRGPPTLAVEIISPSSTAIDRRRKLPMYARYAIPFYWIVDPPARTIEAYQLAPGVYEGTGELSGTTTLSLAPFPDLILDPQEIWRT
jgi:Uma2 family endonuclease